MNTATLLASLPSSQYPRRATGGPVRKGRAYVVGEHRAEVFEPDMDGWIHPSVGGYARSRGGASGGGNFWREVRDALDRNTLASERNAHASERNTATSEMLHAKISAVPPEHVFTAGAKTSAGAAAITEGFISHGSRDPRVVEWMNRRVS